VVARPNVEIRDQRPRAGRDTTIEERVVVAKAAKAAGGGAEKRSTVGRLPRAIRLPMAVRATSADGEGEERRPRTSAPMALLLPTLLLWNPAVEEEELLATISISSSGNR